MKNSKLASKINLDPHLARLTLLVATGILCGLMQSSLNIPWLAFFAFIPMTLFLSKSLDRIDFRKNFLLFFLPYYLVQLSFLLTIWKLCPLPKALSIPLAVLCLAALTLWEALLMYIPLCLYLPIKRRFRLFKHRFAEIIFFCLLVCAGEWLQEHVPVLAFPWSAVWLTVTDSPLLLQSATLFDCRTTTFFILLINALHAEAYLSFIRSKRFGYVLTALVLQCANLAYGAYSLDLNKKLYAISPKLDVICAQDSLEGREKSRRKALESARSYVSILDKGWQWGTDLVLLPESAVPKDFDSTIDEFTLLSDFADTKGCTVVTGSFYLQNGADYNALLAYDKNGSPSAPYFKQVLVPFGEKIPFANLFGVTTMSECCESAYAKPITADGVTIGSVICVESVFPSIVRSQKDQGAQLICISTNDSWFGKSSAREQHYRHSIMRAVENRRYVLRAGNCGISAIISPSGEQLSVKSDSTKGVVYGEIALIGK
ncbi:apolipoprotein N-acyltransferase [Ruminococcus sp.]|uniref:apolipoprotein N-acyltransferase n=1 Tax=Ruminococcus sp. TaxID=41978 RepID=UPI0025F85884|nr:apolipoprotein N-acyltransferase [Ruminococcus sp.]